VEGGEADGRSRHERQARAQSPTAPPNQNGGLYVDLNESGSDWLRPSTRDSAEAIVAGDSWLKPDKLLASGFRFDFPDIESALRHELAAA
jgi:hypothetical protein